MAGLLRVFTDPHIPDQRPQQELKRQKEKLSTYFWQLYTYFPT